MTKRQKVVKYHNVTKIWPVFIWRECFKCNQEFRREKGWRILTGPYLNGQGRILYVCGSCAHDKSAAASCAEMSKRAAARWIVSGE